jgi:hypothetical protein
MFFADNLFEVWEKAVKIRHITAKHYFIPWRIRVMFGRKLTSCVVMLGAVLVTTLQARADFFDNFTVAMKRAGFSQGLEYSYLNKGWTYSYAQYFSDTEYDFGNAEVTLNGTLSGDIGYSTRGIPEVEINMSTPSGLTYDYLYTDGVNKYTIDDGYMNIDQKIIINKYGGYDIELSIDNVATLVNDSEGGGEVDLDYSTGPISIHGNWLVDVVNLTLGQWCGFTLPGGGLTELALKWDELMQQQIDQAITDSESGEDITAAGKFAAVPEPVSMILLVVGGGMIVGRRR